MQFLDKDFKRHYAKEKLWENMGQSESKERGFKEQKKKTLEVRFWRIEKKNFKSNVLKNCKDREKQQSKQRE
jgi:hypothetical protein